MLGTRSKGQILLITLLLMVALLAMLSFFINSIFAERKSLELFIQKEKAFYIAEAGLEDAKSIVANNPYWFTDNPHSPADDTNWIMNGARGSVTDFGGGSYKIVKSSGSNIIFSVGSFRNGKAVLRVKSGVGEFRIL